ncbi:MAG: hydroxyacid dehydrogenase [Bacteroidetes bacterium]|nr:hydroxyacid dehydrogenase [Bacteroidota bacterium]MBK8144363.1 hydroxyacid dehydrogenase [Bacteroidota bacterium]
MVTQVLVAAPISNSFQRFLEEKNYELIPYEEVEFEKPSLAGICGIITSNKLILEAPTLQKFQNLKWIARLGSGMEIIDAAYCDAHQIKYYSSPAGIANSVAEHAMGMLLSLLHNIHSSNNEIQNGQWIREPNRGIELEGLTVGIIGYGHTGSCFAQKLCAFTKRILVYDKYKTRFGNETIQECDVAALQKECDIISFHVPLNEETRHYYTDDFSSKMAKNHILVNTSRGAVADTAAILKGLQSGKIIGACLDVLEEEKSIHQLFQTENHIVKQLLQQKVILTPHIAGYSCNAIEKMSDELMQQLKDNLILT